MSRTATHAHSLGRVKAVAYLAAALVLGLCLTVASSQTAWGQENPVTAAEAPSADWSGQWYTYWDGGQSLLTIDQEGASVEGVYRPGNGRIEGTTRGVLLSGTWAQAGAGGAFEFALSSDGQSFAGRFDTGQYWNGQRLETTRTFEPVAGSGSPRAALASVLESMEAAARGNGAAELALRRYLTLPDNEPALRARNARISRLVRAISLTTFDLSTVPERTAEDVIAVNIGPDGTRWTFPLRIRRGLADLWDVDVPREAELDEIEAGLLAALEVTDFDEFDPDATPSARQAVRDFLIGTDTWRDGGRDRALATLDLSEIPEALRAIDGPLAAEYLRQIFDRVGHPVMQEIPSDPDRQAPVELYVNVGGAIVVERTDAGPAEREDGEEDTAEARPAWAFSAETLRAAPEIYRGVQNLPLSEGVEPAGSLTRAFWVRDRLRSISPVLLQRTLALENWQWLALILCVPLSTFGSRLASLGAWGVVRAALRLFRAAPETLESMGRAFGWPARIFAAGLIIQVLVRELGLRQDASAVANVLAGLFSIVGGATFLFHILHAVSGSLARAAARSRTPYDDIAAAVGGGVAKILVVVAAIVLAAELMGLPYEGVIATLGVGGLALGFAARDAVSNFISAGILLADRPFKKGDLVEVGGYLGLVEDVGLRSTRLRTLEDTVIVVPNAKISEDQVNNWGRLRNRRVHLALHLALDTPRDRVEAFVEGLARAFSAHPKSVPGELIGLQDITPIGFIVTFVGYFETPALDEFIRARHEYVADVVALAAELEIAFAEGESEGEIAIPH